MNPTDYCQYLRYDPKFFFGKRHAYLLIWPTQNFGRLHFRPKIQALEKKKVKNDNCVLPLRLLPKMAQKIQKFFWWMFRVHVTYKFNKVLKKKKKWQNLTSFWKFLPKFTNAYFWKNNALKYAVIWQKNGKKWQLCFTPQIIAENDQKNSNFFLVNV